MKKFFCRGVLTPAVIKIFLFFLPLWALAKEEGEPLTPPAIAEPPEADPISEVQPSIEVAPPIMITGRVQNRLGTIKVSSEPSGADIYIDGRATGMKTPDVITREAGSYKLKLELDGKIYEENIAVAALRRVEVHIKDFTILGTPSGMNLIKGGCFQMGDPFGEGDEKPVHEACVGDYYLSDHEVTMDEFSKFVEESGYTTDSEKKGYCYVYEEKWVDKRGADWRNPGFDQAPQNPVVCVSWNDAVAYADWLSKKHSFPYRLPTEAEWEYAARSGGKKEKWSGTNSEPSLGQHAWFLGNSEGKTHPVKGGSPNGMGVYDMSGNVMEWVSDWYGAGYYKSSPPGDPKGPGVGSYRVYRGGSWGGDAFHLRASNRFYNSPDLRDNNLGFRLAITY